MLEQSKQLPLSVTTNLRQLVAFQIVYETGSVSRAAELLGRTQPAITTSIKKMENELGLVLFERRNRKLFATPEAKYLSYKVERALEALRGVTESARDLKEIKAGNVRIASHAGMAFAFGPKVIADFLNLNPDITVALDVRESNKVNEFIASGHHEIGLSDSLQTDPLVNRKVFRLRCVSVVPEKHRLANKSVLTPSDLSGEPFIAIGDDMKISAFIQVVFSEANADLNTVVQTRYFSTACNMVANGFGVSIVSPVASYDYLDNGLVASRFEPPVYFDIALLRPKAMEISRAANELYQEFDRNLSMLSESQYNK